MLAAGKEAMGLVKKIDYKTLLFFIGLFVVVGGLEQTGVLGVLADFIGKISDGSHADDCDHCSYFSSSERICR